MIGRAIRAMVEPVFAMPEPARKPPGVSVFFQNGQPYTYFKERPINLTEGARLDSGDLAGVVLTRANPVDVPTVLYRVLSTAPIPDHRRVDGDHVADDDEVRVTVDPGALRIVA